MSAAIATAALRVVACAGDARARGLTQGEDLRETIADGLARWLDQLGLRHGMNPDDYLREFLDHTAYAPTIRRWTPHLWEEVRGIADGAAQPFARLLAYNLMDEEWSYGDARRRDDGPACTAVCLRLPGSRTPVVSQTMDIPDVHDGTQVVVRHRPERGPETIVFTGAGMLALMGANAAGIGVVVNNLSMLPSSPTGLPVMFVIRALLEQTTLAAASDLVQRVPHAIGQHYAIGGPDALASFECAANGAVRDDAAVEAFVHTNHPLVNDAVVGEEATAYAGSSTHARLAAALAHLPSVTDVGGLERLLADRAAPISREPGRGSMTFGALVAELTVPPRLRIAPGPPHLTPFAEVEFAQ